MNVVATLSRNDCESTEPLSYSAPAATARGVYLAAFLPSAALYYAQLWNLPHYQFFPWAWLGAAVLTRRALQDPRPTRPPSRALDFCFVACSLLLLAAAIFLDSPWTACLALCAALWALAYDACSSGALNRYGPAMLMLGTTLRPPLGLDSALIVSLQRVTALAAAGVLDLLEITHYLAGNVLVVPGRRLLVEEACSGVNSLFSAGCGTLFYLLWCRRGRLASLLLLTSVPLWVVVANTVRVAATAVLRVQYDIAADEGRLHDFLGLAVFALAMLLIVSTERLFHFYAALVAEDFVPGSPAAPAAWGGTHRRRYSFIVPACAGFVLLPLQGPAVLERWHAARHEVQSRGLPELGREFVPPPTSDWRTLGFERVQRDRGSVLGERSQTWNFAFRDGRLVVSLDYPFVGWHELTECYRTQGWQVESRQMLPHSEVEFVEVDFRDPRTRTYGLLIFCLVDAKGIPLPPPSDGELDELWARIRARAQRLFDPRARAVDQGLSYQLQVFLEAYHRPSDAERAELRRLLQNTVARFAPSLRAVPAMPELER
jgi:exosortase